jgi:four helix bundle protein
MHNFKKLDIWTKSMELVTKIYSITNSFPNQERFGLTSQIQRAAVSIPANIAEGSAKSSNKDFARFLEMSIGSSFELETELIIALNLKYIDSVVFTNIETKINEIQKMINGFKQSLN